MGGQKAGRSAGPAGSELAVDDDLLVDRLRAGTTKVEPQTGPGCEPPSPYHVGLDERPRPVADRRDGLARGDERLDQCDRIDINTQRVRVNGASGQKQRVLVRYQPG